MALSIKPIDIIQKQQYPLLAISDTWERIVLAEIAHVKNGFAFKSEYFSLAGGMPLIRIRDIAKSVTDNFYTSEFDADYIVSRNDILVGMDGDFNVSRWKGPNGLLNQRVCRVKLINNLYSERFLFLCLQPYLNAINAETSSVTVKHLSSRTISEIPLPLPPLNEQHRIVAKIEELFSEIDKGVESLETAKAQLRVYRQSLLKHAFEGKLTAQWRRDNPDQVVPAEQLLEQIKQAREERYQQQLEEWEGAVKAWEADGKKDDKPSKSNKLEGLETEVLKANLFRAAISETAVLLRVKYVLRKKPNNGKSVTDRTGGFRVLRLTCLRQGTIDLSQYKEGDWECADAKNYIVKKGDFLVSRGNGSIKLIGRGGVVPETQDIAYPDTMIRLPLEEKIFRPALFSLFWNSSIFREQIERSARTTAGIYKINQQLISEYVIPCFSLQEQDAILNILEVKMTNLDVLLNDIENNLGKAQALKQSILKKAFSGQLVPQDPTDEPASQLLERIKAEKSPPAPLCKGGSMEKGKGESVEKGRRKRK